MTIPFEIQEQFEHILGKFNFERVWLTMQSLDWRWIQSDNKTTKVPTITQLKARSHYLLEQSYKEMIRQPELTSFGTGTGGLLATCYKDEEKQRYSFLLQFVLTEYDSEDYV